MNYNISFFVKDGFTIDAREQVLKLDDALKLLEAKSQRRYTSAYNDGSHATMVTHTLTCPWCHGRSPAYRWALCAEPFIKLGKEEIRSWAYQRSIFDADNTLMFNEVYQGDDYICCPRCGQVSHPAAQQQEVYIKIESKKILLTSQVNGDVSELLLLAAKQNKPIHLPLYERTLFNFGRGRCYIQTIDANGIVIKVRDVTEPNEHWNNSTVHDLLEKHYLVRRKLAAAFRSIWEPESPFPYSNKEIKPRDFLYLVRFFGYRRSFYDVLPYDSEGRIERSFCLVDKWFHTPKRLIPLYYNNSSSLPQVKSIRRLFFSYPELFIYLNEIQRLWALFQDINILGSLLERTDLFEGILSFMHNYPSADVFFRDFIYEKGTASLIRLFNYRYQLQAYSLRYAAMTPIGRCQARKSWIDRDAILRRPVAGFSVPEYSTVQGKNQKADSDVTTIDGYTISYLKSREEYAAAGKELDNCLREWDIDMKNPVAVIKREKHYMAAFEVCVSTRSIVQARGRHNVPIGLLENTSLYEVLKKYAKRNHLRINLRTDLDEYIEFLMNNPD